MRQALGPGALGGPGGSGWRGRWEGGSGWGRPVNSRTFHFNVWQNSLQIKKKKKKKKIKYIKKKENLGITKILHDKKRNLGDLEEEYASESYELMSLEENPVGQPQSSMRKYDLSSVWLPLTKYHRLAYITEINFFHSSGGWSLRSGWQYGWVLVQGPSFWLDSHMVRGKSKVSGYKDTNSIMKDPPPPPPSSGPYLNLITSQRLQLQVALHRHLFWR